MGRYFSNFMVESVVTFGGIFGIVGPIASGLIFYFCKRKVRILLRLK